jgi:hypothetical protein
MLYGFGTHNAAFGEIFVEYHGVEVIDLRIGDFVQCAFQADQGWDLNIQNDPDYLQWSPELSLTYMAEIPS